MFENCEYDCITCCIAFGSSNMGLYKVMVCDLVAFAVGPCNFSLLDSVVRIG